MNLFGPPDIRRLEQGADVPALSKAMRHRDPGVRADATRALAALSRSGNTQAVEALIAALEGGDISQAARALAVEPLLRSARDAHAVGKDRSIGERAEAALVSLGPSALDGLRAALADGDRWMEWIVISIAARLGDPTATPLLSSTLQVSLDPDHRASAAEHLGLMRATSAADVLFAASSGDRDQRVRAAAAGALAAVGDPRAADRIADVLCESLMTPDHPAVRGLLKALLERHLAGALGEADRGRITSALAAALPQLRSDVCHEATEMLRELGGLPSVDVLVGAVERRVPCAAAAVKTLGEVGDRRAVDALIAALNDDAVGGNAAEALGKLGDPRAVRPLAEIVLLAGERQRMRATSDREANWEFESGRDSEYGVRGDSFEIVRRAAVAALQRIGGPEAEQTLAFHERRRGARKPPWLQT